MTITAKELEAEIASKPLVDRNLRDLYWTDGESVGFTLNGKRLGLARMTAEELAARAAPGEFAVFGEAPYWIAGQPAPVSSSARIDHVRNQTPVKNQLDRLTCASFATVAAMEAILKGQGAEAVLSEQYAIRVAHGGNPCLDVTDTVPMVTALEQQPICVETLDPYHDRLTVTLNCAAALPPGAASQAKYLIAGHQEISNVGLAGPSITNTDYLESLLFHQHDIVVEMEAAFDPQGTGIQDVQLDPVTGDAMRTGAKHDLLVVGYDRRGKSPFFICKNSYGQDCGYKGYFLFSYHYMNTYAIRGVIVDAVKTVPVAAVPAAAVPAGA